MPEPPADTASVDVAALFAQLQEEVRRSAPRGADGGSAARVAARGTAERLWPVSTDRHIGGRGGALGTLQRPVKLLVRKLTRWLADILDSGGADRVVAQVRNEVLKMCAAFPVYGAQ